MSSPEKRTGRGSCKWNNVSTEEVSNRDSHLLSGRGHCNWRLVRCRSEKFTGSQKGAIGPSLINSLVTKKLILFLPIGITKKTRGSCSRDAGPPGEYSRRPCCEEKQSGEENCRTRRQTPPHRFHSHTKGWKPEVISQKSVGAFCRTSSG